MKRILSILAAFAATIAMMAQNIAVVSPSNSTTIHQTLDDAITSAAPGSTIYLPGGGFQIKEETHIDKKVTIMGVSHRGDSDNVDGPTMIGGNLSFIEGSSGSSIVGIYISGNVNIGTEEFSVDNIVVKYCNINSVLVKNANCSGIIVNQCYLRSNSNFGNTNAKITNNITATIQNVNSGTISNNIVLGGIKFRGSGGGYSWDYWLGMSDIYSSIIDGNIFSSPLYTIYFSDSRYGTKDDCKCYNCQGSNNYGANWGDSQIGFEVGLADVFVNWNNGAISPASNFHFKKDYIEYESKVGIYSGTGFSDKSSLAPIPRIVSKSVEEQSDASGKLKVIVTVKSE